ncbi:MAG: type II toxin-antitoxin system MqsA family antitoxin [Planctomycetes bacterium]|nr:type II toxin-antitoxin system MqsA family antitoxin [Planctomycetota bacterium]
MKRGDEKLTCELCGKHSAKVRRVTRTFGKGENLLLVENVPVVFCQSCHESYVSASTLHEIERIKKNRKQLAKSKPVDTVKFG